jgi:hypothetical protein
LRGASAIAEVLHANPDPRLRVFVIWEPVLATDWGTPSDSLTANVPDRRTVQFYDRQRRLSAMLGGVSHLDALARERRIGFRMKDVVWDTVLVYPPGVSWGSPADLMVAPVVKFGVTGKQSASAELHHFQDSTAENPIRIRQRLQDLEVVVSFGGE